MRTGTRSDALERTQHLEDAAKLPVGLWRPHGAHIGLGRPDKQHPAPTTRVIPLNKAPESAQRLWVTSGTDLGQDLGQMREVTRTEYFSGPRRAPETALGRFSAAAA